MDDFIRRLRERKLVQWALAYGASAFALIQILDIVAQRFAWPEQAMRLVIIALTIGFFVALVLAWYHGERGAQRISGTELLLLSVLLAIGGGLLWKFAARAPEPVAAAASAAPVPASAPADAAPAQAIDRKAIAVLPFENLSEEKTNEYFASGMQDMILTKLAEIGQLKVVSRSSTREYGSRPGNLKTVGQQLGVATVLEGSVQKAGNQVLINVQLIDAGTDQHLWAQAYTRTLDNVFGVESEVADKIAEALHFKLTQAESTAIARAPTSDPEAYSLYLKANYEREQFVRGDALPERAENAIAYLQQAIARDPRFAEAYLRLGGMQNALVMNQMRDTPELRAASVANVEKALALQPDLAEAQRVLGTIALARGDVDKAREQAAIVRRLLPNDAATAEFVAQVECMNGEWARGANEIARALALDPRNTHHHQWSATISGWMRRYESAAGTAQQGLEINPQDAAVRGALAQILTAQGRLGEAGEQFEILAKQDPELNLGLASNLLLRRDAGGALAAVRRVPEESRFSNAGLRNAMIGQAELALGHAAPAAEAIDQARAETAAALQAHPETAVLHATLARVEMLAGRSAEALRAIDRCLSLSTVGNRDFLFRTDFLLVKAEVLARSGDAAAATALLRQILQDPGGGLSMSPALLRLEPLLDPIRSDAAFKALLGEYPATISATTGSSHD